MASFKVTTPAIGGAAWFEDILLAEAECVKNAQLYGAALLNDTSDGDRNVLSLERRIVQIQDAAYVFQNAVAGAAVVAPDPRSEVVGVDGHVYLATDAEVSNSLASMLAQGWSVGNDGTIRPPVRGE